jgi:nucleic acid-binding domain protein
MMKYSTLLSAIAVFLGFSSMAEAAFVGPTELKPTTVAEVKSLPDETSVVLQGYIEKQLGGEDYLFKDGSGDIKVEIDAKKWGGLTVTPKDKVEIRGEVDTHKHKPTDIEVDTIHLLK